MPGKQLIDAGDLVICDAAQNICEPNLRIDAIQFGRFYRFTSTVVNPTLGLEGRQCVGLPA
jgi:hypothetical protein